MAADGAPGRPGRTEAAGRLAAPSAGVHPSQVQTQAAALGDVPAGQCWVRYLQVHLEELRAVHGHDIGHGAVMASGGRISMFAFRVARVLDGRKLLPGSGVVFVDGVGSSVWSLQGSPCRRAASFSTAPRARCCRV